MVNANKFLRENIKVTPSSTGEGSQGQPRGLQQRHYTKRKVNLLQFPLRAKRLDKAKGILDPIHVNEHNKWMLKQSWPAIRLPWQDSVPDSQTFIKKQSGVRFYFESGESLEEMILKVYLSEDDHKNWEDENLSH
ncbi:hypothetical protein HPP92_020492 [Vanilla planifolia]|uniref:Uncharacterized protein n=1 Tax=Vanilla planifolia TaxID=51239 RepID=A0A835UK54_VANPL|nr:hypothetical protein HPP92_020492 [Vanilla planifolia]